MDLINGTKVLTYPFLPFSAEKLHRLLGYEDELLPHGWQHERLAPGTPLPEPKPLFTKVEIDA